MDENTMQMMMTITVWKSDGLIRVNKANGRPIGIWLGKEPAFDLPEFLLMVCAAEKLGPQFAYNFESGNYKVTRGNSGSLDIRVR